MNVVPEFKERFLEMAEEDGWLEDRGKKRDIKRNIEIARGLKLDNIPISIIVKNTGHSLQEVETL